MILPTEYQERIAKYLTSVGATSIRFTKKKTNHPRVYFTYDGRERFHVFPGTPGDAYNGIDNNLSSLRHFLGLVKAEKTVGQRRSRKRKPVAKTKAKIAAPVLVANTTPGWQEQLQDSKLGYDSISYRLERAFIEWWKELMARNGGKSLLK